MSIITHFEDQHEYIKQLITKDMENFFLIIVSCIFLLLFTLFFHYIYIFITAKRKENEEKQISSKYKNFYFLSLISIPLCIECTYLAVLKINNGGTSPTIETAFSMLSSITGAVFFWIILGYLFSKYSSFIDDFKFFFNCINKNKIYIFFSNVIGYAKIGSNEYEFEEGLSSFTEIKSINKINKIFSKHPLKSFDITKGLVDSIWEASMPQVVACISKFNRSKDYLKIDPILMRANDSFIVVGSTNKNFHRRFYFKKNKLTMKFPWENSKHNSNEFFEKEKLSQNSFFNRVDVNGTIYSFFGEYNIAIIEKIYIGRKTIFFCSGVRADDSLMAVEYLFKNWKKLHEKYDKKFTNGFGICIGATFSTRIRDSFNNNTTRELISFLRKKNGEISIDLKFKGKNTRFDKYSKISSALFICTSNLEKISKSFTKAICDKADSKESTLSLINSWFTLPSGKESGEFVALDFGGTNIRANIISLFGDRSYRTATQIKETLKNILAKNDNMSSDLFFNAVAIMLEKITHNSRHYKLGHTFSFPCKQTSCNNATLIKWTKEIKINISHDDDINGILASSLRHSGITNIEPAAIINDTIGVLLAKAYITDKVSIGSICGTGHNSAFFDAEGKAINLESGNFGSAELRDVMTVYDKNIHGQVDTSGQMFEKMVSGAYLHQLFKAILDEHRIEYTDGKLPQTAHEVADLALNSCLSDGLKASIAQDLLIRSARLIAASYHGIIRYLDPQIENEHVIAIDGSLFCKNIIFSSSLHKAINELFGKDAEKIQIVPCPDFSALGAAVAAAMAVAQSEQPRDS